MKAQVGSSAMTANTVKAQLIVGATCFALSVPRASSGLHAPLGFIDLRGGERISPRKLHLRGAAPLFTWGREVYVGESIFT